MIGVDGEIAQYNGEWEEAVQGLIDEIVDQHGIVQEARAADGTWYLTLKFVDRDAVSTFQSYFRDRGLAFEFQRLHDGAPPKEREYDLTPEQHEVLTAALKRGYFAVPRDARIDDLADDLGISTNAVSQRLRRATENLVRNAFTVAPPSSSPGPSDRRYGKRTFSFKARTVSPPVASLEHGRPGTGGRPLC